MTTPEIPVDGPEGLDEAAVTLDAPETPPEATPKLNREARFRSRAQAAEARVAELETAAVVATARIDEMNRRSAEKVAAGILADPAELWRDGTELAALVDDVGIVSEDAVVARANQLIAERRYLAAPRPQTPAASIVTGTMPNLDGANGWQEAFTPQNRA